ncbi:MerR family transcriptional regulator [Phreatobacter stygius]|uniref:MerR family transcriptional regulator n=1 Tax=Phreatobacter stygius TaxID=1940610 RepID=A0A4D7B7B1_9HYPH|nr:MerR family transcriptional regulator [Phreatobacter stygius]QCI68881.1 MerR family transcriptional regulator [Phreatobacter stygius]
MDKAPDAYRTISEVAEDLDLPQHVLRFWETRFAQIRPLKRGGGRRYYRPEDIDLLKGIRHLLYGEGYTIRGVQRIIKESGIKAIQALGRGEGGSALPKPGGPDVVGSDDQAPGEAARSPSGLRASLKGLIPGLRGDTPHAGDEARARAEPGFAEDEREPDDFVEHDDVHEPAEPPPSPLRQAPTQRPGPDLSAGQPWAPAGSGPRPVAPPSRGGQPAVAPVASHHTAPTTLLAADDIRKLQSALFELTECRKRLDQAFETR